MPSTYMPIEYLTNNTESHEQVSRRNCQELEAAYTIANLSGQILAKHGVPISAFGQPSIPLLTKDFRQPWNSPKQKQVNDKQVNEKQVNDNNCQISRTHSRPTVCSKYKNDLLQNKVNRERILPSRKLRVISEYSATPTYYTVTSTPKDSLQADASSCAPINKIPVTNSISSKKHHSQDFRVEKGIEESNFLHSPVAETLQRSVMLRNNFPGNYSQCVTMHHKDKIDSNNDQVTFAENQNCGIPTLLVEDYSEQSNPLNSLPSASQYALNFINSDGEIRGENSEITKREIVEMEVENEQEKGEVDNDRGGRFVRTAILVEEGMNDQPINLSQLVKDFQATSTGANNKKFRSSEGIKRSSSYNTLQAATNQCDANKHCPYSSPKIARARNMAHNHSQTNERNLPHILHTQYLNNFDTNNCRYVKEGKIKSELNEDNLTKIISTQECDQAHSKSPMESYVLERVYNAESGSNDSKRKPLLHLKKADKNNYNAIGAFNQHQATEKNNIFHADELKESIADVDQNCSMSQPSIKIDTIITQYMPMDNNATQLNNECKGKPTQLALSSPWAFPNRRVKSNTNLSMSFKATNPEFELEKLRSGEFGTLKTIQSYYKQLDTKTAKSLNPLDLSVNKNARKILSTKDVRSLDHLPSHCLKSLTRSATSNISLFKENNPERSTNLILDNSVNFHNRSKICAENNVLQQTVLLTSDKLTTSTEETFQSYPIKHAGYNTELKYDNHNTQSIESTPNKKQSDLYAVELATSQLNVKDDETLQGSNKSSTGSANIPDCQLPPKKRRMFDRCKAGNWQSESCQILEQSEAEEEKCFHTSSDVWDIEVLHISDEQSVLSSEAHFSNIVQVDENDIPTDVRVLLAPVQPDEDGDLPLHIAVVQGMSNVVTRLLPVMRTLGISIDSCNHRQQTPLHLAFMTKNSDISRTLLVEGANMTRTDRHGNGILHLAVQYNSIDCLRLVFADDSWKNQGLDVNALNYEGFNALHLAVQHHRAGALAILLDSGRANVNFTDGKNGRTALYFAAESNDLHAARILLAHNADVQAVTYSGYTAMQMASERSHFEFLKLIERKETIMKS